MINVHLLFKFTVIHLYGYIGFIVVGLLTVSSLKNYNYKENTFKYHYRTVPLNSYHKK